MELLATILDRAERDLKFLPYLARILSVNLVQNPYFSLLVEVWGGNSFILLERLLGPAGIKFSL